MHWAAPRTEGLPALTWQPHTNASFSGIWAECRLCWRERGLGSRRARAHALPATLRSVYIAERQSQGWRSRRHCHPHRSRCTLAAACPPASAQPPCVTFRLVVAPLRGPGRSPVLPFACCVGSLLSVGLCGRCSCWCCFRVRGAQWLVCRGCAECGGMCRVRVSGAQ